MRMLRGESAEVAPPECRCGFAHRTVPEYIDLNIEGMALPSVPRNARNKRRSDGFLDNSTQFFAYRAPSFMALTPRS